MYDYTGLPAFDNIYLTMHILLFDTWDAKVNTNCVSAINHDFFLVL